MFSVREFSEALGLNLTAEEMDAAWRLAERGGATRAAFYTALRRKRNVGTKGMAGEVMHPPRSSASRGGYAGDT